MKILSSDVHDKLWNKIIQEYKFRPGIDNVGDWIVVPGNTKTYYIDIPWDDKQEMLVNSFFEKLVKENMFALNWQHDCFEYSPTEHIPLDFNYYDPDRMCHVYFPSYYSNGDYYFFFDKDWNYGIFGHPWRHVVIVKGKELIKEFEDNHTELGIKVI